MHKKMLTTGRYGIAFSKRYSPRDRRAIGIAVMVLGAYTLLLDINSLHVNQQFAGPTTKVIGTVDALFPSRPRFLSRHNPNIAYSYLIGSVAFHTVAPVCEEVFDGLHVGGPLPVKYLPENPTMNRIDLPAENMERQKAPYWLTAMSILFICAGAYVVRTAHLDRKSQKTHRIPRDQGFIPDLKNHKELRVRGWRSEDFSKILTDFRKLYEEDLENEIATKIQPLKDGTLRVTFPQDVPDRLFPFLINYAQYPKGFKTKADSVLVAGRSILSEDFEGHPSPKLIGQEAVFYVPSDDREYDVVYVQVGEETFENSFASSRWKKVAESRLPTGFAHLFSVPRTIT